MVFSFTLLSKLFFAFSMIVSCLPQWRVGHPIWLAEEEKMIEKMSTSDFGFTVKKFNKDPTFSASRHQACACAFHVEEIDTFAPSVYCFHACGCCWHTQALKGKQSPEPFHLLPDAASTIHQDGFSELKENSLMYYMLNRQMYEL